VIVGGFVAWTGLAGAQQPPVRQGLNTTPAAGIAAAPGFAAAAGHGRRRRQHDYVLKTTRRRSKLNNQIKNKVQYYANL